MRRKRYYPRRFEVSALRSLAPCDDPYQSLANAVIVAAVDDYRKALRKNDAGTQQALEGFFYSEWFTSLTGVNPAWLVKQLCGEIKNGAQTTDCPYITR